MGKLPKLSVVVGVGDGSILDGLDPQHTAVLTLPGETPPEGHASWPADDLDRAVSFMFAPHHRVVQLANADFYDAHPVEQEDYRKALLGDFYGRLCRLPMTLGDTVLDGLQGVVHMAQNWETLRYAPTPGEWASLDCPAIAVGAGPSLAASLDALRELQHSCLIVASISVLDGLLDAGIQPHVVAIHERVPLMAEILKRDHYPGVVFGGLAVVRPEVTARFDSHLMVGNTDLPYIWMGVPPEKLHFVGRSAGTQAVALALQLTKGPVYLVGHDLCFRDKTSHWGQSTSIRVQDDGFEIDGYQGRVRTQYWWDIFRNDITAMVREQGAEGRVFNVCPDGALIEGVPVAEQGLPDAGRQLSLPPVPRRDVPWGSAYKFRRLTEDCAKAIKRLPTARRLGGDDLFPERSADMFVYILRSVYGSASMDRRQHADYTVEGLRQTLTNVLTGVYQCLSSMSSTTHASCIASDALRIAC